MNKYKKISDLFFTFMKIGLFTFGGGYGMIPLIENNCVEKKKWITHDDIMNVTVIAESTPGPIAINCATFVGYRQAGIAGAIFATLGVIIPSFVIIFIISKFLDNFLEIKLISNAFSGIKIAVGLLILNASFNMIKKMNRDLFSWIIVCCSTVLMLLINIFSWKFSSITMLIIATAVSVVFFMIKELRNRGIGK